MIVKSFRMGDYIKARLINGVGFEQWNLTGGIVGVLLLMEKSGTFWTVWEGDEVVLISGWYQAWEGVCEVSLLPTELFRQKRVESIKLLKKHIQVLTKRYRRIQVNCRDEELFLKFAELLGFSYEGRLRKFGYDGKDHIMMSIVGGS